MSTDTLPLSSNQEDESKKDEVSDDGGKRKRDVTENITPSPDERKKPKTSYAAAASSSSVVVVPNNYPTDSLNKEQFEAISTEIRKRISSYEPEEDDDATKIKIRDISHRRGSLFVTCATDFTKKWLEDLASRLRVGDVPLKTVEESALARYVRARCFLQGTKEELVPHAILQQLRRQNNRGLMATHWTIADIRREARGAWVVFRIPEAAIPCLHGDNYEVYYLAQVVSLKVFSSVAVNTQGNTNRSESVPGTSGVGRLPGQTVLPPERPVRAPAVQAAPPAIARPPGRMVQRGDGRGRSVLAERERRRRDDGARANRVPDRRREHRRREGSRPEEQRSHSSGSRGGRSVLLVTEAPPAVPPGRRETTSNDPSPTGRGGPPSGGGGKRR